PRPQREPTRQGPSTSRRPPPRDGEIDPASIKDAARDVDESCLRALVRLARRLERREETVKSSLEGGTRNRRPFRPAARTTPPPAHRTALEARSGGQRRTPPAPPRPTGAGSSDSRPGEEDLNLRRRVRRATPARTERPTRRTRTGCTGGRGKDR